MTPAAPSCSQLQNKMIINERDSRKEHVLATARQIMTAARTAPKGKGFDIIEIITVTDETIKELSDKMIIISHEKGLKFFLRDADNILQAEAIILVGTRSQNHGLNCGYCGFGTCMEKLEYPAVPCTLNSVDVGIALGSACATAADCRVDSRVMFSVGLAAQQLGLLPDCQSIFGIPISASSKSPFFDRKPKETMQ